MTKPQIHIAPNGEGAPLPARNRLLAMYAGASYHESRDCRHPLGVYNISIARICDKVRKCAEKLENYWKSEADLDSFLEEIIDYLELSMYAAAEHVDDLERIVTMFFKSDREAFQSPKVRLLKRDIKPLRDEISSFTNTIKHAHGRIRLYETTLNHDSRKISLIGFFIEGFKNGTVLPNEILHKNGKTVISITSFLWGILTYLAEMSTALDSFLREIKASDEEKISYSDDKSFSEAAIGLAKLPLYSFDDEHPFIRVQWKLTLDKKQKADAESGIYGSLINQWSKSEKGNFSSFSLRYASDGITKSFNLARPTALRLTHWG